MSEFVAATNMICLMSRTDYNNLSVSKQEEIRPYYDAFQDAVKSIRFISGGEQTTMEIMVENILVEEANKLLWYGVHDLVSPGDITFIEIHNFDRCGNTIDIEKYIIDGVVMSIVKHAESAESQSIQITGTISKEITIADAVKE